jgi:hypothetical protein
MQAIENFFIHIFGSVFNRATYSATHTVETKVRETIENQYDQAVSPKKKEEVDRDA